MKKTIITVSIVVLATASLFILTRLTSKKDDSATLAEVRQGNLKITVTATGELVAENSVDILAPDIEDPQANNQNMGGNQQNRQQSGNQQPRQQSGTQGGSQGGNRSGGGGGGGFGGGGGAPASGRGGGGDIRATPLKINDMIPEGTIVKKGDYIAQLDRTEYDNTLKDDYARLTTYQTGLDVKIIDTAVVLNQIRDDITNQIYLVNEAKEKLRNSKYESPDIIRQAEINYERTERILEQKERYLKLMKAQTLTDVNNYKWFLSRTEDRIRNLEALLASFTIRAPSDGMVIYMKDRRGAKRTVGSMITPYDRVVATIPDLKTMVSKTYVSEIEVNKVKPGMKVDITIDAFPLRSYTGTVISVANIGEVLPNSDSKVFETLVRIDGSDFNLRPSMTTGNEIVIKEIDNVVYVPTECIRTDAENITYVYTKHRTKQVVVAGEANDKFTIIEQGLKPGTEVYEMMPDNYQDFRLSGEDLIPVIRERNKARGQIAKVQ